VVTIAALLYYAICITHLTKQHDVNVFKKVTYT